MKIRVNFEWEMPQWLKHGLRVGLPITVLLGGIGVAWAALTSFSPGEPLTAAGINANFADLDGRTRALEGRMASGTKSAVAQGDCLDVVHGFNTYALGYSARYSTQAGPWVPVQPGYQIGGQNLAQGRPASAFYTQQYTPASANDGATSTSWVARPGDWWQVDLGTSKLISQIRVNLADDLSWTISVSPTGRRRTCSGTGAARAPSRSPDRARCRRHWCGGTRSVLRD